MSDERLPVTPAMRVLREFGVEFTPHTYKYEAKGGTAASSRALGVPEHHVVKTLIMEDETRAPLIVLMHGDKQVSTRQLARAIGAKSITPCKPEVADKHTGYQVGGTSPLGTRREMPVYVERSITLLPRIWINGGRRGFLIALDPRELVRVLAPTLVEVALDE
ncbi:MAG: Cys-tRNA(Pro) deacylase [Planctomycetes bacterium]|nr:Cys-tRNA(Pro) deacylase [Planctomycetota bacterium]